MTQANEDKAKELQFHCSSSKSPDFHSEFTPGLQRIIDALNDLEARKDGEIDELKAERGDFGSAEKVAIVYFKKEVASLTTLVKELAEALKYYDTDGLSCDRAKQALAKVREKGL